MHSRSGFESMLDGPVWIELQEAVASFRSALLRGDRPDIESYLPADATHRPVYVSELVHEELEHRLRAGETVTVESYLDRFEELRLNSRLASGLHEAVSFWRGPGRIAHAGDSARSHAKSIGRYELGEVIGRGAFGVVHRAYDTTLRRAVALKRPRPGAVETPEAVERFLREARAVAGLRHHGIVAVHDAGQDDGELYLVSDLIEGRNLAEEMAERRPGFRRSAEWLADLAEALDHAHRLGVIHRDVKPSNVLIDADDHVYLTDFGLAKSDGGDSTLTADSQVIGTPAYMAPEQTEDGPKPVDARTDVYSLGVILYELLTAFRPFTGTGPMLLARIREEEPRPPRRLDDAIPRDLETVCLKAMAKRSFDRYGDAASFAADLRRWIRGEPVLARPVGAVARFARRCRRKPILSGLAASLVLAVVAGFVGVTWEWRRAESFRRRAEGNLAEMKAQRDRATQALGQGYRSLSMLNALAINDQLDSVEPAGRRGIETMLVDQYRMFRRETTTDPLLRLEVANAAFNIARLLEGRVPQPELIAAWREAHDLHEGLARDEPDDLLIFNRFAECLLTQSQFLRRIGRDQEAREVLHDAAGRLRRGIKVADAPTGGRLHTSHFRGLSAQCRLSLGNIAYDLGQLPEAISAYRRSGELAEANLQCGIAKEEAFARAILSFDFFGLAKTIGVVSSEEARLDRARLSRWSVALLGDGRSSAPPAIERATLAFFIGAAEDRADWAEEALRDLGRAVELYESLGGASALKPLERIRLATAYHVIGRLHSDNGRPLEALEPYRKAIAIREGLHRFDAGNLTYRDDLAGSWHRLGEAFENLTRFDEALAAYRKGIAYRQPLAAGCPTAHPTGTAWTINGAIWRGSHGRWGARTSRSSLPWVEK